jgi:hypothetical protein
MCNERKVTVEDNVFIDSIRRHYGMQSSAGSDLTLSYWDSRGQTSYAQKLSLETIKEETARGT